MNTHETYVSLEVAKLLKQAGFDWKCRFAFLPTTERGETPYAYFHKPTNYNDKIKYPYEVYSAPTLSVAQRWLREVKRCFVNVYVDVDDDECVDTIVVEPFTCGYIIEGLPYCNNSLGDDYIRNEYGDRKYFDTYEEALEAGIKKCLELILEKDEINS